MSASTGATTPPSGTPAARASKRASQERAELGPRPASQRRTVLAMCGAYLLMTGTILLLWLLQP